MQNRSLIGRTIDNYRIDFMLGQGGMAAVYRATDLRLQRQVAIKLMHPHLAAQKSFQARFLQEARSAARLDHPNIVRILAFNNLEDELILIMELATGGNLRQYIKSLQEEGRGLDWQEGVELVRQMAEALDYAHQQGMIHRDIKPDNVLLKPDSSALRLNYRPILTDFGLAKLTSADGDAATDQQPIGTYPYMSPEQCLSEELDARSDIYSLGIMLFEVICGQLPYRPQTIAEAARMHAREPIPLPNGIKRDIKPELEAIILKAMSKAPIDRFNTAGEMAVALNQLLPPAEIKSAKLILSDDKPFVGRVQAATHAPVGISTDISTQIMQQPIPLRLPNYAPQSLTDELSTHDHVIFYSPEHLPFAHKIEQDVNIIGRSPDATIVLAGGRASRKHARLERKPNGKYTLTDLDSSNGTYLGDQKLAPHKPAIFNPGMTARIGDFWVRLELKQSPAGKELTSTSATSTNATSTSGDALKSSPPKTAPEAPIDGEDSPYLPLEQTPKAPEDVPFVPFGASAILTPPPAPPAQSTPARLPADMPTPPPEPPAQSVSARLPADMPTPPPEPPAQSVSARSSAQIPPSPAPSTPPVQSTPSAPPASRQKGADVAPPAAPLSVPSVPPKAEASPPAPVALTDPTPTEIGAMAGLRVPYYTPPYLLPDQFGFDRLVFISEDAPTITQKVDRERLTIGRDPSQDIILNRRTVSRRHARVERGRDGKLYIIDEGAANGLWQDAKRLPPFTAIPLDPNKPILIGGYWMQYELKRELPRPLLNTLSPNPVEDDDPYKTALMVKPLGEVPHYSPPPLSIEMRASDRLQFISEDHPMLTVKLDREVMVVGRDRDCDVRLDGKRISRQHLRIEAKLDGNLYVTDLGSANGTWVDQIKLVPNTEVVWEANEIIRLGNYWLKFERGDRDFDPFGGRGQDDKRGLVGKRIKNYRIDRFIGQGRLASVYKATEQPLDRAVALKIMHPNLADQELYKQRFLQEARVLSKLEHPNIVRVLSYDNAENELFMVMELISGGSLRSYLNTLKGQNRSMNLEEAIGLVVQLADGLHFAHQQGLIHRDMKPENIVLRQSAVIGPIVRYQPIMTDFGVAQLSESGEIFITDKPSNDFQYMSPEQCLGQRVDYRSDIYELGVVLYEMLVGRPPYQPRSIAEAIRMHVRETLVAPSEYRADIPEDVVKVILRALEKDPNNRYQTAIELARALQRTSIGGLAVAQEGGASVAPSRSFEEEVTQVMPAILPSEMPVPTRAPSADERIDVDLLVIYSEDQATRTLALDRDVFTIGRDKANDIVLSDPRVSRSHARLERGVSGKYRLVDLSAKNSTWLGANRLIQGVGELWNKGDTVRIGTYWMRIEHADDRRLLAELRADKAQKEAPAPIVELPARPVPTLEQERIGVNVDQTILRVAPGSSTAIAIEVANYSDVVDHFRIEVYGLPSTWYTVPVEPLYLLPRSRDTASVSFHPPANSSSASGGHAYEIRVLTRAQGIQSVASQGILNVDPFHAFVSELQPQRIRGAGRAEVSLHNTGNTHGIYTIQGRDREQAVRVELEGRQYQLPPDGRELVTMRVTAAQRHWFGRSKILPFEVKVSPTPLEIAGGAQTHSAELVVYPRIPIWLLIGLLLIALLCGVITFLVYGQVALVNFVNQTATAAAYATHVVATATADASADSDGDGLANWRERELGTLIDVADTDGDGLNDGEEVFVWGTNPLNRDTDGDTLTDGAEVQLGLSPLKADTDGDEIPDNQDLAPLILPTASLTPFPTIPGTDGDLCAGSPIPSRLEVGMQAFVSPGGVPNRVRALPSPADDSEILTQAPPGALVVILDGPECDTDKQLRWWQVNYGGIVGWMAEGEGEDYYMDPPDAPAEEGGGAGGGAGASDESSMSDPPEEVAQLDAQQMGIQINWDVSNETWNSLLDFTTPLGVGWVKVQAAWTLLEPNQAGEVSVEFTKLRDYLQRAKDRGYKVLVSVAKAPAWARSVRDSDGPPDDPQQLARFVTLLLQTNAGLIDAIEIWNEPNLRREWVGTLSFDGAGYMNLFAPTYQAIRQVSQEIVIITAGLAPTFTGADSVNDRDFLQQMIEAGLGDYADIAIGVHPYGWGNPPNQRCCTPIAERGFDDQSQFYFLETLAVYRELTKPLQNGSLKLWATEFGWASWEGFGSTAPEVWMTYNSTQDKAAFALQAFRIGQAHSFMGPMFLWNLNFASDSQVAARDEKAGYSLLLTSADARLVPRPSYDALIALRGQANEGRQG